MKRKTISKLVMNTLLLSMVVSLSVSFNFTNGKYLTAAYAATSVNLPSNIEDGVILHAFDWSFDTIKNELPNIAAAGYKTVQVSPVQGTKDSSKDANKWWLLYQPTNQSVGNSQLGSYEQFKELCDEADQYGISIVVDVVMNHMANNGSKDQLDSSVDPSFKNSSYYHNLGQCNN